MVAEKPPITTDIAALDTTQSDIWKRLTIIKTEAWFNTVQAIAMEYQVRARLESRYMKSAIICDVKAWISHYESANTVGEAVGRIASLAN